MYDVLSRRDSIFAATITLNLALNLALNLTLNYNNKPRTQSKVGAM